MPFKDIREFIARLEKEGEATRIEEEVDWNLEAGALVRLSNEQGLPAPVFQKVKGYPDGYIDVCLFNGAIRNSENEEMAHLLRQKSKVLVAYGSCAYEGCIPALSKLP